MGFIFQHAEVFFNQVCCLINAASFRLRFSINLPASSFYRHNFSDELGGLVFRKARNRKHKRHRLEVCPLPVKATEPAVFLRDQDLCHSLLTSFNPRGASFSPRLCPSHTGTAFCGTWPHITSSPGSILQQTPLKTNLCVVVKQPPHCRVPQSHSFVTDQSACRKKPCPSLGQVCSQEALFCIQAAKLRRGK